MQPPPQQDLVKQEKRRRRRPRRVSNLPRGASFETTLHYLLRFRLLHFTATYRVDGHHGTFRRGPLHEQSNPRPRYRRLLHHRAEPHVLLEQLPQVFLPPRIDRRLLERFPFGNTPRPATRGAPACGPHREDARERCIDFKPSTQTRDNSGCSPPRLDRLYDGATFSVGG